MISKNHRKEMLSRTMVRSVAAKAGVSISESELDYGIDIGIVQVKERKDGKKSRLVEGNEFRVQLKCSENIDFDEVNSCIKYNLEAKTYNDLVDKEVNIPRILVLVHVPQDEKDWISISNDELVLKKCAYWQRFTGQEPTANTSSVTISIPIDQRFTPEFIVDFLGKIEKGEV